MIRVIRWLWLVLPRGWVLAVFLAFYVAHESLWLSLSSEQDYAAKQLWLQRNLLVAVACAAFGVFRVAAFHPLFRPEYRKWLELTPWTSRKPLPVGPIHWVPQDGVVLCVCLALLHTHDAVLFQVLAAFALAYQTALAVTLWPTGLRWQCYTILFVLGAAVWLFQTPAAALAIVVVLYPFTYWSLHQSLKRFPWQLPDWWPTFQLKPNASREDRKAILKGIGWPYERLQPIESKVGIDFEEGAMAGVLAGWWVYAMAANLSEEARIGAAVIASVAAPYASLYRIALYCSNYWWPISLWGRLRTGRWIIPRYDRVLVAPILGAIIPAIGLSLTGALHGDFAVGTAVSVTLAVWVLLNMGPKLSDWQLTGGHRIVPGINNKRDFVQL